MHLLMYNCEGSRCTCVFMDLSLIDNENNSTVMLCVSNDYYIFRLKNSFNKNFKKYILIRRN